MFFSWTINVPSLSVHLFSTESSWIRQVNCVLYAWSGCMGQLLPILNEFFVNLIRFVCCNFRLDFAFCFRKQTIDDDCNKNQSFQLTYKYHGLKWIKFREIHLFCIAIAMRQVVWSRFFFYIFLFFFNFLLFHFPQWF